MSKTRAIIRKTELSSSNDEYSKFARIIESIDWDAVIRNTDSTGVDRSIGDAIFALAMAIAIEENRDRIPEFYRELFEVVIPRYIETAEDNELEERYKTVKELLEELKREYPNLSDEKKKLINEKLIDECIAKIEKIHEEKRKTDAKASKSIT
ncbi:hypothetical protein [Vulcanisaeta sp. JCM 16159]|uniref:hypothetical protein n=1 Tax=Vulcanisaeta sp. JCM 16159 TaxID=1295371 RepID=UPI0006D0FFEF|nr:hypothetical protein [Vulcanisaeta sp. JCM 16159]